MAIFCSVCKRVHVSSSSSTSFGAMFRYLLSHLLFVIACVNHTMHSNEFHLFDQKWQHILILLLFFFFAYYYYYYYFSFWIMRRLIIILTFLALFIVSNIFSIFYIRYDILCYIIMLCDIDCNVEGIDEKCIYLYIYKSILIYYNFANFVLLFYYNKLHT